MTHTNATWNVDTAHKNRRSKVKVETPTGERFYLDPNAAKELGEELSHTAKTITERHDDKEGFCPRCYDYHPFRIQTLWSEHGDVTGAFCANCDFCCEPSVVPHDAEDAEYKFPDEV